MVFDTRPSAPEASNSASLEPGSTRADSACAIRRYLVRRVAGAGLRGLLALAAVMIVCLPSTGAERWSRLSDTVFRQVAQGNEIPYDSVPTALSQDGDGFLWLGTQNGLARWDGYRFRQFPPDPSAPGALPDTSIQTLHTDRRGRLWIGMNIGGLGRYDHTTDRFISYPVGRNGLNSGSVLAVADDGGTGLWVGTSSGLNHLDPDSGALTRLVRQPDDGGVSNGLIQSLLLDRHGTLWVGLEDGGLVQLRRGTSRFRPVPLPRTDGKLQTVSCIAEDGDGQIWVGTTHHGAFVIGNPATGRAKLVAEPPSDGTLELQWVRTITQATPGEVWLGTYDDGVVAVDIRTMRTRRIRHNPGLPSSLLDDTVRTLYRDRSGLIWAGTNRSVSSYDPRQAAVATLFGEGHVQNGIRDPVVFSALALPNGRVWLGFGSKGMDLIDPVRGRVAALKSDPARPRTALPGYALNALALSPAGQMFVGSERGLYRADSDGRHLTRLTIADRDPVAAVRAVLVDRGILWFGGLDGLFGLNLRSGAVIRPAARYRLTDERVTVIARGPHRSLWIGTQNGLNRFDLATRTIEPIPGNAADPTALWPGFICTLLTDRSGRLWVGGDDGIAVSERPATSSRMRFTRLAVAQGMTNTDVSILLPDRAGNVWASTDDGFAIVDSRTFAIWTMRRADGVAITSYFNNSGTVTTQGDLVFGGIGGASVVRPERVRAWTYSPPVVVTEAHVGGKLVTSARFNGDGSSDPVSIAPDANTISLGFSALDFSSPERNRYAYRLDGFDKDWIASDATLRLAAYTNLAPGDYTLRLRGSNRNGVWSPREVRVPIRVEPAWYQTIWARVAEAFGVLVFLVALVQGRTAFLRRHERELEQQVADRTAELEESRRHLEQLAHIDSLTGLPNRRMFAASIRDLIARTRRRTGSFALLLIDLDKFKNVNDTLGHDAGDALLVQVAVWLRGVVREADSVSRLGGDEFAILLADTEEGSAVESVCRRIVESFASEFAINGMAVQTSPSIGVAMFPAHGDTQDVLYKCADLALYEAKHDGRNTWRCYRDALKL